MREHECPATTPVSDYPAAQGLRSVSASNIISVIRADTHQVGAARLEFPPEEVGTHSLRSGRAMVTNIAEVPDQTLMAIGGWRSLGSMVHIQQQISSFSAGVSVRMSEQPWFWYL